MKTKNFTSMPVGTRVTARKPRKPEMTVVVRGKFSIVHGGSLTLVEEPDNPLVQGFMSHDVFADDDDDRAGESLYPSDFADFKLHGEAMLKGSCFTPRGQPLAECPVKMSVGAWSKSLKVVGRRVFSDGTSGAAASAPIPFSTMPITWSNAFGGPAHELNPVGKSAGAEAPNVEPLGVTVRSRGDRIAQVSFAPINPAWAARARKVGKNYGADWKRERSPFYSDDFDWTHFQSASADQWFSYLRGDEELKLQNLDPKHQLVETRLPGLRVRAFVNDDRGRVREVKLNLDTLFADLDEGFVYLTWRGLDEIREDDCADVTTLMIASEPLAQEQSEGQYRALLAAFEADPLGIDEARKKLLPDTTADESKLAKFNAFQSSMTKAANDGDPDAMEKAIVGALDFVPGDEGERLKKEVPALLAKAKENVGDGSIVAAPGKGFAEASAKSVEPPNLMSVKPGQAPPIPGAEAAAELKSLKARLPEVEKAMRDADISTEGFDAMKAALDDPRLARFGEEPPQGTPPVVGEDLSGMDLRGRDLRGADLSGCNMTGTLLTGANLAGARLVGATLERALLDGADLTAANLTNANLTTAVLTGVKAAGAAFTDAKIDRTLFDGANLRAANFDRAVCNMVLFMSADMEGAHAEGATFNKCMWNEAKLDGAQFERSTFDMSMVRCSTVTNANFSGARIKTTAFIESDLTGVTFAEAKGEVAIFQKSIMNDAEFRHADLFRSHFTEAKLTGAKFVSADLRGSRFYRSKLTRANFEHANLLRADFSKADLERVKFRNANLYEAKFLQAYGGGTDFLDANLKRALLERS